MAKVLDRERPRNRCARRRAKVCVVRRSGGGIAIHDARAVALYVDLRINTRALNSKVVGCFVAVVVRDVDCRVARTGSRGIEGHRKGRRAGCCHRSRERDIIHREVSSIRTVQRDARDRQWSGAGVLNGVGFYHRTAAYRLAAEVGIVACGRRVVSVGNSCTVALHIDFCFNTRTLNGKVVGRFAAVVVGDVDRSTAGTQSRGIEGDRKGRRTRSGHRGR